MHAHAAVIDFNYVIFYVLYTTTLITVNISRGGGGGGRGSLEIPRWGIYLEFLPRHSARGALPSFSAIYFLYP